jgi:hypothetical protein
MRKDDLSGYAADYLLTEQTALREQAARCYRMVAAIRDARTHKILIDLAAEYTSKADALDVQMLSDPR